MKSMKSIVLAATILTLTMGAFPKHASAAADIFLQLDGIKAEQSTRSPVSATTIVSILASLLLL